MYQFMVAKRSITGQLQLPLQHHNVAEVCHVTKPLILPNLSNNLTTSPAPIPGQNYHALALTCSRRSRSAASFCPTGRWARAGRTPGSPAAAADPPPPLSGCLASPGTLASLREVIRGHERVSRGHDRSVWAEIDHRCEEATIVRDRGYTPGSGYIQEEEERKDNISLQTQNYEMKERSLRKTYSDKKRHAWQDCFLVPRFRLPSRILSHPPFPSTNQASPPRSPMMVTLMVALMKPCGLVATQL